MLIAIAMLFAPFAIQSGSAMAAMPSQHHAEMASDGHCSGTPAADKDSKAPEKPCCAAMCAAVAVSSLAIIEPTAFARSDDQPSLEQFHHGFLAKLPTPPPRLA